MTAQAGAECSAEEQRARQNSSLEKSLRVAARGEPTNVRKQGLALFEARVWSSGEREFAACL